MIIGLDMGGTHTDVVLLDRKGLVRDVKVPTDSNDLFQTVLRGLEEISRGVDLSLIRRMVLSTTLTTNTIIQGKTPAVGMIVCGGPGIDPELFRTNTYYHVVSGAVDHRGREIAPIDADEIRAVARQLQSEGILYVGVVGKFSTRNPEHELAIADVLKGSFDKIFLGHKISGQLNFSRRIATVYLNASVYPIHKRFFEAVEQSLEQRGFGAPIRILKADGGNMNFQSSIDFPGQTILSGPAASVMGAVGFAAADGATLVMDIGGTTTDMAVLVDGVPLLNPNGITVGGYKTLIRALETYSIGIGGDSCVSVKNGKIRIGPRRYGPAMAYGGSVPTPTDALAVLGKIRDGNHEKALAGIGEVAGQLGISAEMAAYQIFDQTCREIMDGAAQMVARINRQPVYTVHELLEGHQVHPASILVLGGPAPFFVDRLGDLSGWPVRLVPKWGVANAIGAALARTTCQVTFFADTEQKLASAPEEEFSRTVDPDFSREAAVELALELLRNKAIARGANPENLQMEVTEDLAFNMVRGFNTTGKNIRIQAQVKPGLITGFGPIIQQLETL
jgi:N-methylhydantoinase A/oxoprolinase/acetone carboxylase beta subunit